MPVKEQYTGSHKCKGNKFTCQETQISVCLNTLSQPKTVKNIDPMRRWEDSPMRTIHVSQAGRDYFIDGIFWGDDAEGVMMYLRAKGISPDDIVKALEGVAQAGGYLIQQE